MKGNISGKLKLKKICLFSDHHICINPRMWKEAFFYEKLGFEVVVYSMWIAEELLEKDKKLLTGHSIRYQAYLNMIPGFQPAWKRNFYRIRKKLASVCIKLTGLESWWAITYSPELMYSAVKRENADLYVVHMESGLLAGKKLMLNGRNVAVDFEDWYSHDYLLPGRPVKLLTKLEKFALRNALFCTATSKAMAAALQDQHGIKREITVIYNGFSLEEIGRNITKEKKGKGRMPKLIWFSRNIGPDRGIETLFKVLKDLDITVELHLLGFISENYKRELRTVFPEEKGHQLFLHDFMAHHELAAFLSEFDIGLALEESEFPSRDVTITNKILQYLQAGIKILATDTSGQKEVAEYFSNSLCIVKRKNAVDWLSGLKDLIGRSVDKDEIQFNYSRIFSWEAQQQKLEKIIEHHFIFELKAEKLN